MWPCPLFVVHRHFCAARVLQMLGRALTTVCRRGLGAVAWARGRAAPPLAVVSASASARTLSLVPGSGDPSTSQESDELVSVPIADIPSGWKGVKRFYDHVGVRPVDASGTETLLSSATGYKVLIQGRELRTNGMHDLIVRRGMGVCRERCLQGRRERGAGESRRGEGGLWMATCAGGLPPSPPPPPPTPPPPPPPTHAHAHSN
jgi:hypothetical protein